MRTLNDVIDAIKEMSVSEFRNRDAFSALYTLLSDRDMEWHRSGDYEQWLKDLQAADKRRLEREQGRRVMRAKQVQQWIDEGKLKKGTFIKVSGTRDGNGIREVIEVADGGRLVCRQWTVAPKAMTSNPRYNMEAFGYKDKFGMWMRKENQITTHDFNKVVEIL